MKILMISILVCFSIPAFSQETIRITPGNSVTLNPQTEVRVVCEAAVATNQTVRYCQCRPNLYNAAFADLIQMIKGSDGRIQSEVLLFRGLYFGDCYNAMVNNINCR